MKVPNAHRVQVIRQRNPCMTTTEIGLTVGLTRERVRQILAGAGLRTRRQPLLVGYCTQCGKELYGYRYSRMKEPRFCGPDCRRAYAYIDLVCDNCGRLFKRRATLVLLAQTRLGYKGTGLYCGRRCLGLHVARAYGFLAHPENTGKRKYDYAAVKRLRETGWTFRRLAEHFGMPNPSVAWHIVHWRDVHDVTLPVKGHQFAERAVESA